MWWCNGDEAKKSKRREDVAQDLLNLTFRNQVMVKLDEYKNLEILTVAYNGMGSSYVAKIDQSIWVLENRWHLQMVPDLIASTVLPTVLVYHSLLNRDPVEESFEFTEQKLPTFQNVVN